MVTAVIRVTKVEDEMVIKLFEKAITLAIGASIVFLIIQPVADGIKDSFNRTAACIDDVRTCHG